MSNSRNKNNLSDRRLCVEGERIAKRDGRKNRKQRQPGISSYICDEESFPGFSNQLDALGLKLRDIPGDGNCLFRALGDQLDGDSQDHARHREETVNYMISHRDDFEPFVEDDATFSHHVENLRVLGTYAGNDAIVAFARKNNVNVVIHQLNAPIWTVKGCDRQNARQLHIAYHNGDHYSSIRKITDNSRGPANIKLSECKESENVNRYRTKKKPSDSLSEYEAQTIKKVANITGCQDHFRVKQALRKAEYDENEAVGIILEHLSDDDDHSSNLSGVDCTDNNTSIWSENGTGTRIFGNSQSEKKPINRPSKVRNNTVAKTLSNKNRKEQARRDRKKRNEERRKNQTPIPIESDILVKKLSVLNI